jgi:hypothetical protein
MDIAQEVTKPDPAPVASPEAAPRRSPLPSAREIDQDLNVKYGVPIRRFDKGFAMGIALLMLVACGTGREPGEPIVTDDEASAALIITVNAAVGTLNSFIATGDVPEEAASYLDATIALGRGACVILEDPAMTPTEKTAALVTGLTMQRTAFDAAVKELSGADVGPHLVPSVNAVRALVQFYAPRKGPEFWAVPCGHVMALHDAWAIHRPPA